jgi:iduronate 2-sulfatase
MIRILCAWLFLLSLIGFGTPALAGERPNVLLIIMDDLRTDLDRFYPGGARTPALDRLSEQSIRFDRAYTNVPVCGASRASFLTGIRPRRDRFVSYHTWAQEDAAGTMPLSEAFRRAGYVTHSIGKVFHHPADFAQSWTVPAWQPSMDGNSQSWRDYQTDERLEWERNDQPSAWEAAGVDDSAYFDGRQANRAVAFLEEQSAGDRPFFLALGFVKPHLPFNAPKKYWDRFDPERIRLTDVGPATGAPDAAWHNMGEIRAYREIPPEPEVIGPDTARSLVHGYLAALAYADAQAGRVLDAVDRLGLDRNTIVVFMSDHGYALGEHELWVKHSTFNVALQVPFMFRVPGLAGGEERSGLVEYLDLYPTLVELTGLEPPQGQLEGKSLVPMLRDPAHPGKDEVFPRWQNADSIVSGDYLYTEWLDDKDTVYARMLYDHSSDPDERTNIAESAAMAPVVQALSARLALLRQGGNPTDSRPTP